MSEFRYTGKCYCGQALSLVTEVEKPYVRVSCPSCNRSPSIPRIEGTFNPDHKCDSRCTGAKGNICSCACGGANHGRDHGRTALVQVTSQAQHKETVRRERQHIGEVDQFAKGAVRLLARRPLDNGKFLFSFETQNTGDRITWFVPDQYAPDWDAGWEGTVRFKVIRHEDHAQYGKSTIVIFVEEVS